MSKCQVESNFFPTVLFRHAFWKFAPREGGRVEFARSHISGSPPSGRMQNADTQAEFYDATLASHAATFHWFIKFLARELIRGGALDTVIRL